MSFRGVLLIDDEDDIREVAQLSLEIVGRWDVVAASSGAEGIRFAEAEQPDAILLDVMMPGMDGATTYHGVQANPMTRTIPVILLTAKSFDSAMERNDRLDGITVIGKPFDPLQLPKQIVATLSWAA